MRSFKRSQKLPIPLEEAWAFLSDPRNLKTITPPSMGFDIHTDHLPSKAYAGQIITYTVKPLVGIPLNWVTEITHLQAPYFFVDEQRFGPYRFWHHQHWLKEDGEHTLMEDIIHYKVPGGPLGNLLAPLLVIPKLQEIFAYREKKLKELFPGEETEINRSV